MIKIDMVYYNMEIVFKNEYGNLTSIKFNKIFK